MRIDRVWAMPNKETFKIKPIAELLREEMDEGFWADPFSGNNSPATLTNDLNPTIKADYHIDALAFLKELCCNEADGILFDPPYSPRQVSECYKQFGYMVTSETTRSDFWTKLRTEITRVVKPEGKVISFGWNSQGIGKTNGFTITRILLVPHGGFHNDTIVTVEVKNGAI